MDMFILMVVGFGFCALAFAGVKSPKRKAKESYDGALDLMGQHPDSSAIRQAALQRGRAYHKLAKTKNPEMAIKNDLDSCR